MNQSAPAPAPCIGLPGHLGIAFLHVQLMREVGVDVTRESRVELERTTELRVGVGLLAHILVHLGAVSNRVGVVGVLLQKQTVVGERFWVHADDAIQVTPTAHRPDVVWVELNGSVEVGQRLVMARERYVSPRPVSAT